MEPNEPKRASPGKEATADQSAAGRLFIFLVVGLALFYLGGWYIGWGISILGWSDGLYLSFERGVAVRFNGLYYGMFFVPRFFNSPFVSLACFIFGWGLIGWAIEIIFGSNQSE